MTDDAFIAQRRLDDFRAAVGHPLDRFPELDELLAQADRFGWTAKRIGQVIAAELPAGARPGLVVLKLRAKAMAPEPAPLSAHALAAVAGARTFRQPRPPCGNCDGSPARWVELPMPDDYRGQPIVDHCPVCWTRPPAQTG